MSKSTPSVLDPDETWYLPAQVYVAARPDRASAGPMLELRTFGKRQQQVVLAFSTLDGFLAGCGADQPWVSMPAEQLAEFARDEQGGYGFSVVLDRTLTPELRGTAGGFAQNEPGWNDETSEDWDYVYVPSRPFERDQERAHLELQPLVGDHLALMIYSSLATLEAGCGPNQHWVSIPAGLISEARRQSGADTICLDTPLPTRVRHGATEGD